MKILITILILSSSLIVQAQYESGVKNYLNVLNVPDTTLTSGYQLEAHARKYFNRIPDNGLSSFAAFGIGYFQWYDKRTFQSKRNSTLLIQAGLYDEDMMYGYGSITYLWYEKAIAYAGNVEIRPFQKFIGNIALSFTGQIGVIKQLTKASSATGFLSLGAGLHKKL